MEEIKLKINGSLSRWLVQVVRSRSRRDEWDPDGLYSRGTAWYGGGD
jgi:hypothetical protein